MPRLPLAEMPEIKKPKRALSIKNLDTDYLRSQILLWASGTPEQRVAADQELDRVKAALSPEQQAKFDGYVADVIGEQVRSEGNGTQMTKEQKNVLTASVAASLGTGIIKMGTGLAQILDAQAKKKGLTAPQLPKPIEKNPVLQSELGKSLVRQEQGDPVLRQYYRERIAEQQALTGKRAQSAGNIGQYLGNVQGAQYGTQKALADFYQSEAGEKRKSRAETRDLLGQSMEEDFRIQNDYWRRFGAQERRYSQSLEALQAQINSGYSNMFTGLNEAAGTAPGLAYLFQQKEGNRSAPPSTVSQNADTSPLTSRDNIQQFIENTSIPNTYPVGKALLLGNEGFRTPENIWEFQNIVKRSGAPMADEFGKWGEDTQKALEALTTFDPMAGF